jgi:molybdopterin-containing oxidoreductase family membrane subunit
LAGVLLSALILPIFVSVHSVVSWDFAVVGSVEGWHSTIFAPYFVIGAILSGVAAVVTVMVLMRSLFGWQSYIRLEHFDAMARLLIVVAIVWFHFFFLEFTFGLYGLEGPEIALREMVLFHAPWNILFAMFLMFAFVIPVTLWFFRRVRRSMRLMLATTLLVNVGMWLERFLIIIPGPARKQPLTFSWGTFAPSVVEITIVVGSFAGVALGLLLFAKVFPLLPLSDQKEAQVLKMDMQMGKARLTAVVRE